MLHVLLLILKIVGLILAVLLGLVLFLLLILLLVPVRYRAFVSKREEFRAEAKITWLLHLLAVPVTFQDGVLSVKIKLFGITIKDLMENEEELEKGSEDFFRDTEEEAEKGEANLLKHDSIDRSRSVQMEKDKPEAAAEQEPKQPEDSELPESSGTEDSWLPESSGLEDSELPESSGSEILKKASPQRTSADMHQSADEPQPEASKRRPSRLKALWNRILSVLKKIRNLKYTFRRFCVKIKRMIKKLRDTKEFLTDERTKAAVRLCLDQVKLLLRRLLPKKIRGEVHFGTEDPALTGQILGGISIFYPVFMDNVKVHPDFEQSCLDGELFVKGRFRLATMALIAIRLLKNKNVWYVYRKLSR